MDERILSEPGYQLVWPRSLFAEQAARLLNERGAHSSWWDPRAELLFEHAFVNGYSDGVCAEFQAIPSAKVSFSGLQAPRRPDPPLPPLTKKQEFLRELLRRQDQLHEDPPPRRPFYSERVNPGSATSKLDMSEVAHEFANLVQELDGSGYFDKRFGVQCDDQGPVNLARSG
ncbi:hypothetical protein [Nocardia asteroides]|uniref:hypothetical protein n=1 Tax=Nocardia asteroides TaxID=1824 RepID=UPI003425954A